MNKSITLFNGIQKATFTHKAIGNPYFEGRTLDDVYDNCSGAKWSSFNYWSNFFTTGLKNGYFDDYDMYITSHNTFQYTLAGTVDMEGLSIKFKITAQNNYFEIIEN